MPFVYFFIFTFFLLFAHFSHSYTICDIFAYFEEHASNIHWQVSCKTDVLKMRPIFSEHIWSRTDLLVNFSFGFLFTERLCKNYFQRNCSSRKLSEGAFYEKLNDRMLSRTYWNNLEIENYKIRLIHVFILFLTFRPLLNDCQATVNIFLPTELS